MVNEDVKTGVNGLLIACTLVSGAATTSPLWWRDLMSKLCFALHGGSSALCSGLRVAGTNCEKCANYGISGWVPTAMGVVGLIAGLAKIKDALSGL